MNRPHRKRAGISALLLVAVGLLAALALPGVAAAKHGDSNNDRIPDRWEAKHHLSLHVNQARRDQDRDGLNNRGEFRAKDDPRDGDTDDDGVPDGTEGAGTVASFDSTTGALVINLFNGTSVSGTSTRVYSTICRRVSFAPATTGSIGTPARR